MPLDSQALQTAVFGPVPTHQHCLKGENAQKTAQRLLLKKEVHPHVLRASAEMKGPCSLLLNDTEASSPGPALETSSC